MLWQQIDNLSADEIMKLSEAAVLVLQEGWTEDVRQMPHSPLLNEIKGCVALKGINVSDTQLQTLVDNRGINLALSKALLKEIGNFPELAERIEKIYLTSKKRMAVDPVSLLLAGSLFVLAIKVKSIDLAQGRLEFFKLGDKAIESLCGIFNIPKGK